MKIVGADIIEGALRRHASAAGRLKAWRAEVLAKAPPWTSFNDLRTRYPSVDKVGDRYVFDIGQKFRLVVRINFEAGIVEVRWFGTHAEYDRLNVEEA